MTKKVKSKEQQEVGQSKSHVKKDKNVTKFEAKDTKLVTEDRKTSGSVWPCGLLGVYGCVATALYVYTMYPSISGGDSGELIAAAHELGVAHPPGYPLFTLLVAGTIKLVPVGTVAWRANLLNAVFSGLASMLYAAALHRYTRSIGCAICGAAMWGFSSLTWTWASNAEVFGLNNLFLAALLYLMIVFHESPLDQKLQMSRIGALVCGLSLCNQHTLVLYVAIIAIWVLYELHQLQLLTFGVLVQLGFMGLLGMSPYIYLPVSAYYTHNRWTWGDQRTLQGFLTHFLRAEYGTFDLAKKGFHESESFFTNLGCNIEHLLKEYTVVSIILCGAGVVEAIYRYRSQKDRVLLVAMAMCCIYLAFFSWRANLKLDNQLFLGVVERFWMQSDCVFVLLAVVGLQKCVQYVLDRMPSLNDVPWLGLALSVLVCAGQMQQNFATCNQRDNYLTADFGLRVIQNLPQNATVLTLGDLSSNILRYFYLCENQRPDLKVFDQEIMTYKWSYDMLAVKYPRIQWPGHYFSTDNGFINNIPVYNFETFLEANRHSGPLIGCIGMQGRDDSWKNSYEIFSYGPCNLFLRKGSSINFDKVIESTKNMTKGWTYPVRGYPRKSWDRIATQEMWHAMVVHGQNFLSDGISKQTPAEKLPFIQRSYEVYKSAMEGLSLEAMPDHWHKNFALACQKLLELEHNHSSKEILDEAILHFELYLEKYKDDEETSAIIDAIKHLKTFIGKV